MATIERVEPYRTSVSRTAIRKGNGSVLVWSKPTSAVEGAEVMGKITAPVKVTVTEEQKKPFSARPQRVRIVYSRNRQEGWVLFDALTRRT